MFTIFMPLVHLYKISGAHEKPLTTVAAIESPSKLSNCVPTYGMPQLKRTVSGSS